MSLNQLHRVARIRSGQTILVLGANGGVGSTLVQLARYAGVRVSGTLLCWNPLPNGCSAHFYNFWAGHWRTTTFRTRLRRDLAQVLDLLADGTLSAQVAARFPLQEAATTLRLAESSTTTRKVVLIPDGS